MSGDFCEGDMDLAFLRQGLSYRFASFAALFIPLFGYGPIERFGIDFPNFENFE